MDFWDYVLSDVFVVLGFFALACLVATVGSVAYALVEMLTGKNRDL